MVRKLDRSTRIRAVTLILSVMAGPMAVGGQASPASDPFKLPRGKLVCNPIVKTDRVSERRGLLAFRFLEEEGLIESRTMDATYDSSGHPVYFSVLTAGGLTDKVEVDGFVIGFGANETAQGFVMTRQRQVGGTGSPTPESSSTTPSRVRLLSPAMLASARKLANWLWDHRCGKG
jgi:hypothetical protein